MNPARRQWLLLIVLVLTAGSGVGAAVGILGHDDQSTRAGRHASGPGLDDARLACRGVRVAAQVLDSPQARMATTVLDHALAYAGQAADAGHAWDDVQRATSAFDDAAHGQDVTVTRSAAAAAVKVCRDVPDPR